MSLPAPVTTMALSFSVFMALLRGLAVAPR
jgi:hypothetical protein